MKPLAFDGDDGPIYFGGEAGTHLGAPAKPTINPHRRGIATGAIRAGGQIALAIALADGPLPIGDTIAAVGLLAIGGYLYLTD